ncbi:large ribosomal subunit protein mL52-like [Mytilus edulis]|uniref:large ribosomal subunit protein mL52-like n=1 Tax=Mytilus trossulus TaxID=6551 RepID=UPI0030044CD0
MSVTLTRAIVQTTKIPFLQLSRQIHVSSRKEKGSAKWRISQGQARSGNEYGLLTEMPDYSFLDGRPTPLSLRQQKRRQEKIEVAKDIMKKLGQIDFAKERFELQEQSRQQQRQSLLDNKLKAKS